MALCILFKPLSLCPIRQPQQLYKKCAGRCSIFIMPVLIYCIFPTSACCYFLLFLFCPLLTLLVPLKTCFYWILIFDSILPVSQSFLLGGKIYWKQLKDSSSLRRLSLVLPVWCHQILCVSPISTILCQTIT